MSESEMMEVDTPPARLFKVSLSDERIDTYIQPFGTRACGTNCTICVLSMLGMIEKNVETQGTLLCMAKKYPTTQQLLDEANKVLSTQSGEPIRLRQGEFTNKFTEELLYITNELQKGEATMIVYGTVKTTHAVVLRRRHDGGIELLDPQRGLADIDRQYGFTTKRAQELQIESFPNFYRVKGEYNITRVMIEQSLKFGYATTEEQLIREFVVTSVFREMSPRVGGRKTTRRRRRRSLRR